MCLKGKVLKNTSMRSKERKKHSKVCCFKYYRTYKRVNYRTSGIAALTFLYILWQIIMTRFTLQQRYQINNI